MDSIDDTLAQILQNYRIMSNWRTKMREKRKYNATLCECYFGTAVAHLYYHSNTNRTKLIVNDTLLNAPIYTGVEIDRRKD